MTLINHKIEHPQVAFLVVFLVLAVLTKYGITEGAALLVSLCAGVIIYKLLTV